MTTAAPRRWRRRCRLLVLCGGGYHLLRGLAPQGLVGEALLVVVCAGLGVVGYLGAARLLKIAEIDDLWRRVAERVAR